MSKAFHLLLRYSIWLVYPNLANAFTFEQNGLKRNKLSKNVDYSTFVCEQRSNPSNMFIITITIRSRS